MQCIVQKSVWLALLVLLTLSPCLVAQTSEIDSLKRNVINTQGIERIDALNALAFRQLLVDIKAAESAIDEAMMLSQKQGYAKGLAEAHVSKGICELHQGNYKNARQFLITGIRTAKSEQLRGLEGYALTQIGNTYRNSGSYDSARYWYDESYAVLKDSLNPWQLSVVYRNLGLLSNLAYQPKEEFNYLMRAYSIRKHLPDRILFTDILLLLAQWHIRQGEFKEANSLLEQADNISDVPPEIQKDISYQKAIVLFNEAQYLEGLRLFNEVKDFYLLQGNIISYVKITIDIADLLEELGSNDLSLKTCYDVLPICKEKKLTKEELRARLVILWNFYDAGKYKLANSDILNVLRESQQFGLKVEEAAAENLLAHLLAKEKNYEQALVHYMKGLRIRESLKDPQGRANILGNMGDTYFEMRKYEQAVDVVKESIAIADSIGGNTSASWDYVRWNYLRLSKVYSALKDYERAFEFLNQAEAKARLSRHAFSRNAKDFQVSLYQERRKVLIGQNKVHEALDLSLLLEQLKDSLRETSISDRITALLAANELDKQAQEIALRNDEITIQKAEIQKQDIIIASIFIASVLLCVLLYLSYNYHKKTRLLNQALRHRNEEVQAQSEELSRANTALLGSYRELTEKNEEIQTQSEELIEANSNLSLLNAELAEKQEELEAQSLELQASHQIIAEMNDNLQQKVQDRTVELEQAFKELDTFFYRSSHDFRRPLTTFMGLAEVAKITLTEKNALELFAKVKETAVNLDRMLIKLQSISDVGAEQFVVKPIDIRAILESATQTYSEGIEAGRIKVTLTVEIIHSFFTFPAFLKIVIDNLLENAIQFSKKEHAHVIMEAREKDGGIEIIVKDNGIGIEEEYMDRVFDMFFRGSEYSKGNGLGLYIVKKAVDKLQGVLVMESTYQLGTTVNIWFPNRLRQK